MPLPWRLALRWRHPPVPRRWLYRGGARRNGDRLGPSATHAWRLGLSRSLLGVVVCKLRTDSRNRLDACYGAVPDGSIAHYERIALSHPACPPAERREP